MVVESSIFIRGENLRDSDAEREEDRHGDLEDSGLGFYFTLH
jgi:hypothetical protein